MTLQNVVRVIRCQSSAMSFRAVVDGQQIRVRVGNDGQLWTWRDGQLLIARSDHAKAWAAEHVIPADRDLAVKSCVQPSQSIPMSGLNEKGRAPSNHTQPLEA